MPTTYRVSYKTTQNKTKKKKKTNEEINGGQTQYFDFNQK